MSATLSATSQAVKEWIRVFPRQVTETYTSSVTFMKQLTVVAVSMITYLKNIFPKESFTTESLGGIRLRILKKKCRDDLAQFVSTALTQAFEAFDKKYLHQLALCFYDGEYEADNLVEYHIFEFTYNRDGVTMDLHSKSKGNEEHSTRYEFDDIKQRTLHLLQTCTVVMQMSQTKLPSTCDVSLRLYYNEEAPEGYQAPGFSSAEAEAPLPRAGGERAKLGAVHTRFHRLAACSYFRQDLPSSHEANASQNTPQMTQNEVWDDREWSSAASSGASLRCPCNQSYGVDLELLTCDYCGTRQHALCFGVTRAASVPRHCCPRCRDEDPARPLTDALLANLQRGKRENLCIFRLALVWCGSETEVSAAALADTFTMTHQHAEKLMKLLISKNIARGDGADLASPHEIIPEQLERIKRQYFRSEENDVVDRLLAETLSQGNHADPVGEVLGPMEKVSLQNATAMGKIVEHNPPDKIVEDATLKQYREAILSADQQMGEQLLLSGSHNPVTNMEKIGKKTTKRKMDPEKRQLGVKTLRRAKK